MELVILMGLQASGKSTFARQRFDATHAYDYVSKDRMGSARHKEQRQRRLVAASLRRWPLGRGGQHQSLAR